VVSPHGSRSRRETPEQAKPIPSAQSASWTKEKILWLPRPLRSVARGVRGRQPTCEFSRDPFTPRPLQDLKPAFSAETETIPPLTPSEYLPSEFNRR
jgi:hypothetical protein